MALPYRQKTMVKRTKGRCSEAGSQGAKCEGWAGAGGQGKGTVGRWGGRVLVGKRAGVRDGR